MTKYWLVYSKKRDEFDALAPELIHPIVLEAGRNKDIHCGKDSIGEQVLLIAPADGDGNFVKIQITDLGNDIIDLDLIYDEDAHEEACWDEIRSKRDKLLDESDWTAMPDTPMSAAKKNAWLEYRQTLRDVPQTPGIDPKDENTYSWPVKPS